MIPVRKAGETAVIKLEGRLTVGDPVDDFRDAWTMALNDGARDIVINLEKVTFIDSSGIGTLLRCQTAVARVGGKVKLVGTHPSVKKAFAITRLDSVFEFHDTEQTALGANA